jgi:hypothetical protein
MIKGTITKTAITERTTDIAITFLLLFFDGPILGLLDGRFGLDFFGSEF